MPPLDYGGTELRVHWLTEGLIDRGHDVTLYASGDSRTRAKLRSVCEGNLQDAMKAGSACHYAHYTNAALAEALADNSSFDIVHCHTEIDHVPFTLLSPAPVVFSLRTALSVDDVWLMQRYRRDIAFVAMSRSQASVVPKPPLPVIQNGCDFAKYEFAASPGRYLAFLGRMGAHKNPLGAIEVAKAAGWPILLAGKPQDRAEQAYFEKAVRPLIDQRSVTYLGAVNQEQKRAFLRDAAALLFPIEWDEPFGIVMIEAMASGTPVLALRRGSVEEVIDPGTTGFICETVEEMSSLVPRVIALDRRVVRDQAARRFGHQRMVDDYARLYASILAQRRAAVERGDRPNERHQDGARGARL